MTADQSAYRLRRISAPEDGESLIRYSFVSVYTQTVTGVAPSAVFRSGTAVHVGSAACS